MRTHREIARQGTNDGLCGIYCLINSVRLWSAFDDSAEEDLLRYFLEAAHRLNNFHPYKISDGYEAHELTDIFNEFARAHAYPATAHLLRTCLSRHSELSFEIFSGLVFEERGSIIVSMTGGGHWLLTQRYDSKRKKFIVQDSDVRGEIKLRSPRQLLRVGLVILPAASTLLTES